MYLPGLYFYSFDWYDKGMDVTIFIIVVLGVFGALFGSFACAQMWRLRAHQLVNDEVYYHEQATKGNVLDEHEYIHPTEASMLKPLLRPILKDRSECLYCHHILAWYDLIPVVSWISLRGSCRYCHRWIGWTEFLSEIGLAVMFVVSYVAWPYRLDSLWGLAGFSLWLVACILMTILFIYDAKWSFLPQSVTFGLIIVGALLRIVMVLAGVPIDWVSLLGSILLIAGLYYVFARMGWAGDGDSTLGLGLSLILGRWEIAFLTLFLANLFGCFMLIPMMLKQQLHRQARIPFGPFLIVAAIVGMLWGQDIIHLFLTASMMYR